MQGVKNMTFLQSGLSIPKCQLCSSDLVHTVKGSLRNYAPINSGSDFIAYSSTVYVLQPNLHPFSKCKPRTSEHH